MILVAEQLVCCHIYIVVIQRPGQHLGEDQKDEDEDEPGQHLDENQDAQDKVYQQRMMTESKDEEISYELSSNEDHSDKDKNGILR